MTSDARAVQRFVRRVLATQDSEPDFEQAEAVLAALAEAMARGDDVSATTAWLAPHLSQSPETEELLDELVHLARMEAQNVLPSAEALLADLAPPGVAVPPAEGAKAAATARHPAPAGRQVVGGVGGTVRHRVPFGRMPWGARQAVALGRLRPVTALRPSPTLLAGAVPVLGLALATAVGGWWRADRRAEESTRQLAVLEAVLESAAAPVLTASASSGPRWGGAPGNEATTTAGASLSSGCLALENVIATASEERFARGPAGAWSRVLFEPGGRRALVWCGDVGAGLGPQDLAWWAVGADGLRSPPRIVSRSGERTPWWLIETDRALVEFEALELTAGPDGDTLVRVDLEP